MSLCRVKISAPTSSLQAKQPFFILTMKVDTVPGIDQYSTVPVALVQRAKGRVGSKGQRVKPLYFLCRSR